MEGHLEATPMPSGPPAPLAGWLGSSGFTAVLGLNVAITKLGHHRKAKDVSV